MLEQVDPLVELSGKVVLYVVSVVLVLLMANVALLAQINFVEHAVEKSFFAWLMGVSVNIYIDA